MKIKEELHRALEDRDYAEQESNSLNEQLREFDEDSDLVDEINQFDNEVMYLNVVIFDLQEQLGETDG